MKSTFLIVAPFAIVMLVLVTTGSGGPVQERDDDDDTKPPINTYKRTARGVVFPKLEDNTNPKKTKRQDIPLPLSPPPPEDHTNTNVRGLRAAPEGYNAEEGNEESWVDRMAQNGNHGYILVKRNDSIGRYDDTEGVIEEDPKFKARKPLESS